MSKKNQSSRLERKQNKRTLKEKFESFYDKDKKRSVRDAEYAKKAMLNPFKEDVDASKFPGFDQANRIRGGLKKGGSVKKKKKQGYKDRKDESIAMRIKKKRTPAQLKASRDESYGKFGSKAKKSGKINR